MPTLHELQRDVARAVIAGDDTAAAMHVVADGLAPAARLAVYRNTVVASLTTALRLSYPAVYRLVGAAFFESAAQLFLAARPPRGACLDDYDPGFAEFLADFAPAATIPYLAGVARLDWAVNRALHAPDADGLDPGRLATAIAAANEPRLRFVPHPSVGLVHAEHPVDAIWRAVLAQDDAAMAAIELDAGPMFLLVRRTADGPAIARLAPAAWRFAASLCAGRTLEEAVATAGPVDAAALLAGHLIDGVFTDFAVDEGGSRQPMETFP